MRGLEATNDGVRDEACYCWRNVLDRALWGPEVAFVRVEAVCYQFGIVRGRVW